MLIPLIDISKDYVTRAGVREGQLMISLTIVSVVNSILKTNTTRGNTGTERTWKHGEHYFVHTSIDAMECSE